jgi:O-acetyl-ADP-ribose deacetylase (regulator of RNase III)
VKKVKGNLLSLAFQGEFDVIVHGCNCFCTMGAGIALAIKTEYPEAYAADCDTVRGDKAKLGTFSEAYVVLGTHSLTIVNAYIQYDYRGPGPNVDYDAIDSAFRAIKRAFPGARIGYPMIGAGLAGGDWERIEKIIDVALEGEDHTLVIFEPVQSQPDSQPKLF